MSDSSPDAGLSKTRIQALADDIFAIAMTLMVFDIKLPVSIRTTPWSLQHELMKLWPRFLACATSFVMLGVYWVGHHNQYHYIRRTDRAFPLDQHLLLDGRFVDPLFDRPAGSIS